MINSQMRYTTTKTINTDHIRKMELDVDNNRVIIHWSNGEIEFEILSEGGQVLWDAYNADSLHIFAG